MDSSPVRRRPLPWSPPMRWRCRRCCGVRAGCARGRGGLHSPCCARTTADGPGQPAQHDLPCAAMCAAMGQGIAGRCRPAWRSSLPVQSPNAVAPLRRATGCRRKSPLPTARRRRAGRRSPDLRQVRTFVARPDVRVQGRAAQRATRVNFRSNHHEIYSVFARRRFCSRQRPGVRPRVQGWFDRDQTPLVARHARRARRLPAAT